MRGNEKHAYHSDILEAAQKEVCEAGFKVHLLFYIPLFNPQDQRPNCTTLSTILQETLLSKLSYVKEEI